MMNYLFAGLTLIAGMISAYLLYIAGQVFWAVLVFIMALSATIEFIKMKKANYPMTATNISLNVVSVILVFAALIYSLGL